MKKNIMFIFFLYAIVSASSQVVFHDEIPDKYLIVTENGTSARDSIQLSLNNDSIDDLKLILSYSYAYVSPHTNESFGARFPEFNSQTEFVRSDNFPCRIAGLHEGDTISSNFDWIDSGSLLVYDPEYYMYCYPSLYAGFRLMDNGVYTYGWLKLKLDITLMDTWGDSYAEAFVDSWAYNSTPGFGLVTGDTITSIEYYESIDSELSESNNIKLKVVDRELVVSSSKVFESVQVYDFSGKMKLDFKNQLTTHCSIDCTKLHPGCYIALVIGKDYMCARKFIVL